MVHEFSENGAAVVALDVRTDPVVETISLLDDARSVGQTADVSNRTDVERVVTETLDNSAGWTFLCNNPGSARRLHPCPRDFGRAVEPNASGAHHRAIPFLPHRIDADARAGQRCHHQHRVYLVVRCRWRLPVAVAVVRLTRHPSMPSWDSPGNSPSTTQLRHPSERDLPRSHSHRDDGPPAHARGAATRSSTRPSPVRRRAGGARPRRSLTWRCTWPATTRTSSDDADFINGAAFTVDGGLTMP